MDDIVWRCSKKLCDNRELVYVILSREQRLALQHLCEDAPRTPDIDFHVVLLPCEHDLRRSIVSRRDVSGHLRILDACETEIADLQVAVLINENVAGFEIPVDDACRVDVFQTTLGKKLALCAIPAMPKVFYQDLVEEVLDELLLEGSRGQETVQIGS